MIASEQPHDVRTRRTVRRRSQVAAGGAGGTVIAGKVDGSRSWFLIILPGSEKQLWGFAPAGSPLDRDLLELFNFGKFILDREQDVRVAVQVGKGEGTLKENQVEIIELLAGEWVLP